MAGFVCKCGFLWDITQAPEQDLWIAYSSSVEEDVIRREVDSSARESDFDANRQRILENDGFVAKHRTLIYECPSCHRLAWYRGNDGDIEWFRLESDQ